MSSVANMSYWDAFLPGVVIAALAIAVLPWVDRNNSVVRFCALGICVALSWRYILWRLFDTVPPLDEPLNFAIGFAFVTIEALSTAGTTLTELFLTRVRDRYR